MRKINEIMRHLTKRKTKKEEKNKNEKMTIIEETLRDCFVILSLHFYFQETLFFVWIQQSFLGQKF